jgi:hypothetical protein
MPEASTTWVRLGQTDHFLYALIDPPDTLQGVAGLQQRDNLQSSRGKSIETEKRHAPVTTPLVQQLVSRDTPARERRHENEYKSAR